MPRSKADVLILGAGAAGLAAARALARDGHRVIVLEARDRVGGRVHTRRDRRWGTAIERGAEFIHGRPDATWNLLREAGISAFDVEGERWRSRRETLEKMESFSDEMGKVMGRLSRVRFRDMTFREFLERHASDPGLEEQRKFAVSFVEGFDAADPARVSAKELRDERKGIGDVEHDQFRIIGGYGAILDHVLGEAAAAGAEVRLSSPVRAVRWERGSVAVAIAGKERALHARCAIVTLPVGILKLPKGAPGAVHFDPEPPGKAEALAGLEDGPVVKAILRFREPFWEEGKLSRASFLFDPDANFPTWWTSLPLRVPIITAWAGGPKADRLSGRGEHNILAAAVDGLASLLKLSRRRTGSLLEHAEVADWGADPHARGAYSYILAGGRGSRERLAEPVEGTLFSAGEATDTEGQASTVAGALASGERAALEAAKVLEKPEPNVHSRHGTHGSRPQGPRSAQGPAREGGCAEAERHQLRGRRARHR